MASKPFDTARSIRMYQLLALTALIVLFGGLSAWAAISKIKGAVIANGLVIVESNSKKVQHRDGGIIADIRVKQGDLVKAGDLLAVIDDTETKAELAIVEAVLTEYLARQARLEAESVDAAGIEFPDELIRRKDEAKVAKIMLSQEKLFTSRRAALNGQKEQLVQRIEQLKEEITGLEAQHVSRVEQLKLIEKELASMKKLEKKKLVRVTRVLALEREAARLTGEVGELIAQIARTKGRIGETKVQMLQIEQEMRSQVLTELRDTQTRVSELEERRVSARAKLQRTDIVAPQTGYVHELSIHTIGGVIASGETLMLIVPEADKLVIEAKVRPDDITQVHVGQNALVRLTAFDLRKTPQVTGEVVFVAADLTTPESPELPYYKVRIQMSAEELSKLGGEPLKPGMPVETFVQTGERSPLSFLLKPLSDQLAHVFRER